MIRLLLSLLLLTFSNISFSAELPTDLMATFTTNSECINSGERYRSSEINAICYYGKSDGYGGTYSECVFNKSELNISCSSSVGSRIVAMFRATDPHCEVGINDDGTCMNTCQMYQHLGYIAKLSWNPYQYGDRPTHSCVERETVRCEVSRIIGTRVCYWDDLSTSASNCSGSFTYTGNLCLTGDDFWDENSSGGDGNDGSGGDGNDGSGGGGGDGSGGGGGDGSGGGGGDGSGGDDGDGSGGDDGDGSGGDDGDGSGEGNDFDDSSILAALSDIDSSIASSGDATLSALEGLQDSIETSGEATVDALEGVQGSIDGLAGEFYQMLGALLDKGSFRPGSGVEFPAKGFWDGASEGLMLENEKLEDEIADVLESSPLKLGSMNFNSGNYSPVNFHIDKHNVDVEFNLFNSLGSNKTDIRNVIIFVAVLLAAFLILSGGRAK